MTLARPFAGLLPQPQAAAEVAAPPYDVVSAAEARDLAAGKPHSFLHISRAEIDLPADTDPYSPAVYAKAADNLRQLRRQGILRQDNRPVYYVYRLRMGGHEQTGWAVAASVAAYDHNRIRRHEFTRPDKEDDRVRQIEALNAQTGPVLLAHPAHPGLATESFTAVPPLLEVQARDGVLHQLWRVDEPAAVASISAAFDSQPALYIADGHHRSAAASRVAAARRAANPKHSGDEAYNYFLAVSFPADQMRILPYNRLIKDLHGLSPAELVAQVGQHFQVQAVAQAFAPSQPAEFGMYLAGQWHVLRLAPASLPSDPVARLDVSLLADRLIAPLLGITDPRRDKRIDFSGGIRGLGELQQRVDSGEMAVAFAMFPTSLADLMAVADSGQVMPPKSTWFEPKLADGLVSHLLD